MRMTATRTTESLIARRRAAALGAIAMALIAVSPACAQSSLTLNQTGDSNLSSTNSGQVTLNGVVTNPTAIGTSNSAGTLTAQGASSTYSISDANLNVNGDPASITYQASVTGVNVKGDNTGTVTTNGKVTGGSLTGTNMSQSISATGMANTISIHTTGK